MQLHTAILTVCVASVVGMAVAQDCQHAQRQPVPIVLPTPTPTPVWLPAMGLPPEEHVPGGWIVHGRQLKTGPLHMHPTGRGPRPCNVNHRFQGTRAFHPHHMGKPLEAL